MGALHTTLSYNLFRALWVANESLPVDNTHKSRPSEKKHVHVDYQTNVLHEVYVTNAGEVLG